MDERSIGQNLSQATNLTMDKEKMGSEGIEKIIKKIQHMRKRKLFQIYFR